MRYFIHANDEHAVVLRLQVVTKTNGLYVSRKDSRSAFDLGVILGMQRASRTSIPIHGGLSLRPVKNRGVVFIYIVHFDICTAFCPNVF